MDDVIANFYADEKPSPDIVPAPPPSASTGDEEPLPGTVEPGIATDMPSPAISPIHGVTELNEAVSQFQNSMANDIDGSEFETNYTKFFEGLCHIKNEDYDASQDEINESRKRLTFLQFSTRNKTHFFRKWQSKVLI